MNLLKRWREAIANTWREAIKEVVDNARCEFCLSNGVTGFNADNILNHLAGLPPFQALFINLTFFVAIPFVQLPERKSVGI